MKGRYVWTRKGRRKTQRIRGHLPGRWYLRIRWVDVPQHWRSTPPSEPQ